MGIFKTVVGLALVASATVQILSRETWWFMQNVNLIFHEAGHIIFMPFGNFMTILGGSLLEILVPLIVTGHFLLQRQLFSAAFGAWWLTTAFLSVSVYASDARERIIPLITNDISTHDWHNILSQTGLLKYDDLIGAIFWVCALISFHMVMLFLYKDKDIKQLLHRNRLR